MRLIDEIEKQCEATIKFFKKQGIILDYTIDSLKYIDQYFDIYLSKFVPSAGETISQETQSNLFAIGSYVGEVLIQNIAGAAWYIDDQDSNHVLDTTLKLSEDNFVWPFERVMKRFYNGSEDSIYVYGYFLTEKYYEKRANTFANNVSKKQPSDKKPWWKFR